MSVNKECGTNVTFNKVVIFFNGRIFTSFHKNTQHLQWKRWRNCLVPFTSGKMTRARLGTSEAEAFGWIAPGTYYLPRGGRIPCRPFPLYNHCISHSARLSGSLSLWHRAGVSTLPLHSVKCHRLSIFLFASHVVSVTLLKFAVLAQK